MEMSGTGRLYGVGVGPGDPELMTLKAVRILREAEILLLPAAEKETCTAYRIAVKSVPEIAKKACLCRAFPMTRDLQALAEAHDAVFSEVKEILDAGKTIAFLTLGDPAIYSTYSYIRARLLRNGYPAETVSGIPSFCAAAARLGISLADWSEQIHVVPGEVDPKETAHWRGTRIFMKAGKQLGQLKEALAEECRSRQLQIYTVSNCGMENEKCGTGLAGMEEAAGYFTLVIVKEVR